MKKIKHCSFRTTEENFMYLKLIAKADDRTPAYALNKLIDYCRIRGFDISELNPSLNLWNASVCTKSCGVFAAKHNCINSSG